MKLVLDTNVLVAALIARGTCAELLEYCVREHEIVTAEPLLGELRQVLTRKLHQRDRDADAALRLFRQRFAIVAPVVLEAPVCRDRDDDVVLQTALAGGCAAILTGDQDLLDLDPFRDIRVLTPTAFWKWESGLPAS